MYFGITVKEIEIDEKITREQLVRELVRNLVNYENGREIIIIKDEIIMELRNRIDDKNTIIRELKNRISILEKQLYKKDKGAK